MKILLIFLAVLSFNAYSDATKVFINDTYWKKKIPTWKEYKIKAGSKTFNSPACSSVANGMIQGLTAERAAIKDQKAKHWYNVVSPIFNYIK